MRRSYPWLEFAVSPAEPPIPDPSGNRMYFEPVPPQAAPERKRKLLRRDLLTSIAAAARAIAKAQPEVVLGQGQGAVVSAALARPRMLEVALASKTVSPEEAVALAAAWGEVKVVLVVAPRVSVRPLRAEEVCEAAPELAWD